MFSVKGRGWSTFFYFLVILRVSLIQYANIKLYTAHTLKNVFFYIILIVDAQNQQFGASPISIFPYKHSVVFSRLSQHWNP